jgi:multidrug resistance efflux pump
MITAKRAINAALVALTLSLSACALNAPVQEPPQGQQTTQGQQTGQGQKQTQGQGQGQGQLQPRATALPTRVVVASTSVSADGVLTLTAPTLAVGFDQSSPVTAVSVTAGQAVKKGDVLGTVDDKALRDALTDAQLSLQLTEANIALTNAPPTTATVAAAQAALDSAYASYHTTKAGTSQSDIDAAKRAVDSAWKGYLSAQASRNNACSDGTDTNPCKSAEASYGNAYESWRAAVDSYQKALEPVTQDTLTQSYASVASAKAKLDGLKAGETAEQKQVDQAQVEQAQAAVTLAQSNLAKAKLVSPCDCIVQAVNAAVGALPSSAAFTLVDLSGVQFQTTNLVESDLSQIKVGAPVTVRLHAYTDTFTGKVSAVLAQASGAQGGQALYTVLIRLDPAAKQLLPGMTGQAEITVQ